MQESYFQHIFIDQIELNTKSTTRKRLTVIELHFKEQCNIAVFRNVFIAQVDVAMTIKK